MYSQKVNTLRVEIFASKKFLDVFKFWPFPRMFMFWKILKYEIVKSQRVKWSSVEKPWHINVLEFEVVRVAILSFTKWKKLSSIHLRINNTTAFSLNY